MNTEIKVPYALTPYGFKYGGAEVMRVASDEKRGWVVLQVKSEKGTVQVYVTKTGKIRVHWDDQEMHKS